MIRYLLLWSLAKFLKARLVTKYQVEYEAEDGTWKHYLWWYIPSWAYAKEHALNQKSGTKATHNRVRRERYLLVDDKVIFDCISKE